MEHLTNPTLCDFEQHMVKLCGYGPVADGAKYHLATGGSRIRAKLGLETADGLGLSHAVGLACACGPELLHNASLVHDDLQDNDETRRGHPAVWHRFGLAAAISIGDLMISAAYAALAAHPDPARAITLAHDALARTARGQAQDLDANDFTLPTYRSMVADKTGALIALPVRLALAAKNLNADATVNACCDALAFAYQALDDIADHQSDAASQRVNLCILLGGSDDGVAQARAAARDALEQARHRASTLPQTSGTAFFNLANHMDSQLTEYSDAA